MSRATLSLLLALSACTITGNDSTGSAGTDTGSTTDIKLGPEDKTHIEPKIEVREPAQREG